MYVLTYNPATHRFEFNRQILCIKGVFLTKLICGIVHKRCCIKMIPRLRRKACKHRKVELYRRYRRRSDTNTRISRIYPPPIGHCARNTVSTKHPKPHRCSQTLGLYFCSQSYSKRDANGCLVSGSLFCLRIAIKCFIVLCVHRVRCVLLFV